MIGTVLDFAMRVNRRACGRSGSALILVLWIIGMLSMIVVSFAFEAHLEGRVVSYSRKKIKAEQFAISGFELAKSYLDHSGEITGDEEDEDREGDPRYEASSALHYGKNAHVEYHFTNSAGEEEGTVSVDIEPEDSKRNLNKLTEEDWERILEVAGVPEDDWPTLIDSYFDWIDEDDNERESGAETSGYYEELETPYAAANAPFGSVRELLLVRGFTESLLTGGIYDPENTGESRTVISNGIERLLSVYGEGKVNINAIPPTQEGFDLLMTLPGIEDELTAQAVLEEREEGGNLNASDEDVQAFRSVGDAQGRLSSIVDGGEFFNSISTQSEIFRITSIGTVGRVSKRITATVYFSGDVWRILRWEEDSR